MDFTATAIRDWRLSSQQLIRSPRQPPERIVEWMGGVQAQDDEGALWSIGLRMRVGAAPEVRKAIADRRIVRTWAFRGTLHFVSASDLPWLISLLAPAILAANARRYRQLELDDATFADSNQVIRRALGPGAPLVRQEIAGALERTGISTRGQRMPYLLQRAALDGLICQGLPRGREPTYVLVSQWIEPRESLGRDAALAALAERYLASHGPATVQDLAWWAGLRVAVARQALDGARSAVRIPVAGKELWAVQEGPPLPPPHGTAHLLSRFDDYLIGYKDRSWVLEPAHARHVNAGGGMPRPTILLSGQVSGTWRREIQGGRIVITLEPFRDLDADEIQSVQDAACRYGAFLVLRTEVRWPGEGLG